MSAARKHLRRWHLWFGLLVGPWLLLLALTGSAIAYYDALDGLLNPDWRFVPLAEAPAVPDVDGALAALERAVPGFEARMVDLPAQPGESLMFIGSAATADGRHLFVHAFSHPGTGALLGWRDIERFSLHRRHLMDSIYGLHIDLAMGSFGVWLVGMAGLLWALDHAPALVLAVPRLSRIRASFYVSGKVGGLRHLYDLHRAPSMWLWPITLMLAVTGLALSWPEASRDVVRPFSPVSDRLHYSIPERPEAQNVMGLNEAMRRFSVHSGQAIDTLHPLPHNGLVAIRSHDPRDLDDLGRLWTYIDASTGDTVASRHDRGESGGDELFAWMYPLHSGRVLGPTGQAIILVTGLGIVFLAVKGVRLWLRRRSAARTH